MKSITALVLTLFITSSVLGQDKMKHFGKKIYVDKVPVSLNTAAFIKPTVINSPSNNFSL